MKKKRALILGASQGIGYAIASDLSKDYQLTLIARSSDKLESAVNSFSGEGHDFVAIDIQKIDELLDIVRSKNNESPYEVLVLNSGGPAGGPISQARPSEFIEAFQKHLVVNSQLSGVVIPNMKKNKFGRIVTITSTSVKQPIPHLGVSNTVRAAVASWAKTLSFELAPFGITVNNIMPGFTETKRLKSLIEFSAEKQGVSVEEVAKQWKAKVPMGRFADPKEIAAVAAFLISEKASYVTGLNLPVDGGRVTCL